MVGKKQLIFARAATRFHMLKFLSYYSKKLSGPTRISLLNSVSSRPPCPTAKTAPPPVKTEHLPEELIFCRHCHGCCRIVFKRDILLYKGVKPNLIKLKFETLAFKWVDVYTTDLHSNTKLELHEFRFCTVAEFEAVQPQVKTCSTRRLNLLYCVHRSILENV